MRGTWYVVPTTFDDQRALDLESQRSVVEAAISWGVDGLTAMGVMSEVHALTEEERGHALAAIFAAAGGRVPVAVGCSAGSAEVAAARIARAAALGAAAAMVSAPPLARDLDRLPAFFGRVAEPGLPIVVQDEPNATGVTIPVSALLRCLEAAGSRVVKLEDPPTAPKIARLLDADPELEVFGGLGGVAALSELRRGAVGTMTGFAYPEVLAAVRRAADGGDAAAAAEIFDRYLPLIVFEGQPIVGLAIRKEVLRRRGAIGAAATRGPVLDPETAEELDEVLARVGIVPGRDRLPVGDRMPPG